MTRGSTILLRLWGGLLIAAALVMGPLPLFTFGLMAFGALFALWLEGGRRRSGWRAQAEDVPPEGDKRNTGPEGDKRNTGPEGDKRNTGPEGDKRNTPPEGDKRNTPRGGDTRDFAHAHWVTGAMMLLCAVWFLANIAVEIARVIPIWDPDRLMVLLMAIAFVFPPLIMQSNVVESAGEPGLAVKGLLRGIYVVAFGVSILLFLIAAGAMRSAPWIIFPAAPLLLVLLIAGAGAIGARLGSRAPATRPDGWQRQRSYWPFTLLAAGAALVLMVSVLILGRVPRYGEWLSVVMRSLPLLMLFMASYYERRFEFFDVFVKKSTLFFVLLLLLFTYFSLVPPWLEGQIPEVMRVWILSLTLLPLVFVIPWLSGQVEGWLDRVWLGRKHTTAEAVQTFLDGFAEVTTEGELVAHAQSRLAEVFQAPVRIRMAGDASVAEIDIALTVAVPAYGHLGGEILLGARAQQTPYFRQDLTLLHALAEAFSYMLANLRLQERKQEQDKREQELILGASRAELKALRAQINPHFLFNALNTIAGLIPSDPERAEATVEQLAEVFRYTLRRSENEWARVADEIDFVRSYLEVEQARFGERLRASIEVDPQAADARIPTMMVQTLVENAVKHGLGAVKGEGRIAVEVARRQGRIEIRVADNGPGPREERPNAAGGPERKAGGYGLENVRRRLAGYYGDRAAFELERDEAGGLTLATLTLPLEAPPAS